MIVGLKKRRASKQFYELGVLDHVGIKTEVITYYDQKKPNVGHNFRRSWAVVRTFNPITRGRSYQWESDYIYTQPHLIVKICDEVEPAACKKDDCPYRFRCFTSKVKKRGER